MGRENEKNFLLHETIFHKCYEIEECIKYLKKWSSFWLDSPLKSMRQLLINSKGTSFASKSYRTFHNSKDKWFFILEVLQLSKNFHSKNCCFKNLKVCLIFILKYNLIIYCSLIVWLCNNLSKIWSIGVSISLSNILQPPIIILKAWLPKSKSFKIEWVRGIANLANRRVPSTSNTVFPQVFHFIHGQ